MAFSPTEQQKNAIDASAGTLVSAAAGSGKTAVLARRVLKLLTGENPIDADRILVVTFMSAAAEEMRTRIEGLLNGVCLENPGNKFLYAQKLKLRNAKICTIDSFCIELVRENFVELGISPDFKIGDENAVKKIEESVLEDILNTEFSENSPEFTALLNALCSRFDETDLKQAVTDIYKFSQNLPFPNAWLSNLLNFVESSEYTEKFFEEAFLSVESIVKKDIKSVEKVVEALKIYGDTYEKFNDVLLSDISFLNGILMCAKARDWDTLYKKADIKGFERMPIIKGELCSEILAAKKLRDSVKKDIVYVKKIIYNEKSIVCNEIYKSVLLIKKLLTLVVTFSEKFCAACLKENVMTFSQAEHYAVDLLCENIDGNIKIKPTAKNITGRFDEVLVDEFQDINDMQELLFNILSENEKNLFVVGDVKQSIYAFRGSNPNNFLNKKNRYLPYKNASDDDLKKIILGNNFRSRSGICDYINFLFSIIMNGDKSAIKYNGEEELVHTASFPDVDNPETEIHFIDLKGGDKKAIEAEAMYIADYIKNYMQNGTVSEEINGKRILRKPTYGDFAVILRGVKTNGPIFCEIFKKYGIPTDYSGESVFNTSEVKIMLSLLTVIANPTRDIELVSVLMSPIFNFTAEDLGKYRSEFKSDTFLSSITNASLNGDIKAQNFFDTLNIYRTAAVTMDIAELIEFLYEKTDFLNTVSALENGISRRENLNLLYNAALEYRENAGTKNILAFVDFIKNQSESNSGKSGFTGFNAVKITTIHKSKGLQFPVCILCDTSKRFSSEDSRQNLLCDGLYGVGFRYFDNDVNEKSESLNFKIIKQKILNSSYEEEMRLLYVALTRAEEKLIIVNSASNIYDKFCDAAAISALCTDISEYRMFIENATSYFDWILLTSVIHKDFSLFEFEKRFICDSNAKILFKLISAEDICEHTVKKSEELNEEADKLLSDKIKENISYVYPYERVRDIETKSSVAVIAHKADEKDYSFTAIPDFMSESGMAPEKRGTATHRFMQFCDFALAEKSVSDEINRLYEWEFISESERDAIDPNVIRKFFESDLYLRIKSSAEYKREMRFITEMPAGELNGDLPENVYYEPVVVQGAVDLIFKEKDGIVIVDFKTDRTNSEEQLVNSYSEQLNIYGKACEKIFEMPVKELILYSFSMSKPINIAKIQ